MASNGNNQASSSSSRNDLSYITSLVPNMPHEELQQFITDHRQVQTNAQSKADEMLRNKASSSKPKRGKAKPPKPADYVGWVHFTFEVTYKKSPTKFRQLLKSTPWPPTPEAGDHMPTAEEVDLLASETLLRLRKESPINSANELPKMRQVLVEKVDTTAAKPEDRLARDCTPMGYSGVDDSYDTKVGKCALDLIKHMYENDSKKMCFNYKYIAAVMTGCMGVKGTDSYKQPTLLNLKRGYQENREDVEYILKHGANSRHMKAVAQYLGCTMACLDEDWSCVQSNAPAPGTAEGLGRKQKRNLKAMVFTVRNGHVHPVTDEPTIRGIAQGLRTHAANPRTMNKPASFGEKKKKSKTEVKYQIVEGQRTVFGQHMVLLQEAKRRGKLPTHVDMTEDGGIGRIRFYEDPQRTTATDILINPNNEVANIILERMDREAGEAATLGRVYSELEAMYLGEIKRSRPNNLVQTWLTITNAKNNVHCGALVSRKAFSAAIAKRSVQCVDMKSAYPYVMHEPLAEWILLDHNATPQPFDSSTPISELKNGLYFASGEDRLVMNGSRVYTREELQLAARLNIPFTIHHMVLASSELPRDTFHRYQHAVVQLTESRSLGSRGEDLPCKMRAACKQLLVMAYGKLGVTRHTNMGYGHVTEQLSDVWGYMTKKLEEDPFKELVHRELSMHDEDGYTCLHAYAMKSKQNVLEHNCPMMLQVQGWLHVRMVEMLLRLGGTPLAIKTDAWLLAKCTNPNAEPPSRINVEKLPQLHPDPCIDGHLRNDIANWGCFVEESLFEPTDMVICDMEHAPLVPQPWTDHADICDSAQVDEVVRVATDNGGLQVTGKAGCGKTHLAKKIEAKVPAVIMLAPTHKASNNMEGITIHSFVGANNQIVTKRKDNLHKELREFPEGSVVMVDEVFMCGEFLFYCLNVVKHIRPDLIWILFGDPRQLGAPGEDGRYDYTEHPTLKELACHQRITLTKSYRCDERLQRISSGVYDDRDFKATAHFPTRRDPTHMNITWTNAVVHYVNDLCMKQHMPEEGAVFIPADPMDDRTQDVWLYPGLPLMSCMTSRYKGKDAPEAPEGATLMQKKRIAIAMQNNEAHTVIEVTADTLTTRSSRDGKVMQWALSDFHGVFRAAYCITVYKAQGDTITVDFTIWEYERMGKPMLYTSITRAQRKEQVHLGQLPAGFGSAYMHRLQKNLQAKLNSHASTDRRDGLPVCDVTCEDFMNMIWECGSTCRGCGEELKLVDYTKGDGNQVTLDRLDNTRGHTKDNVKISCLDCNVCHDHEECWLDYLS